MLRRHGLNAESTLLRDGEYAIECAVTGTGYFALSLRRRAPKCHVSHHAADDKARWFTPYAVTGLDVSC